METFVLGAAHSGKSEWALTQLDKNRPTSVIGTAVISGLEDRIKVLISQRPSHWITIEDLDLYDALEKALASQSEQVIIDSLNLWLANYLLESWHRYDRKQQEARIGLEIERIFGLLSQAGSRHVLTISSEVGSGITPPDELSRFFRSSLGLMNQRFAARANTVVQIVAGLPIFIRKPTERPQT